MFKFIILFLVWVGSLCAFAQPQIQFLSPENREIFPTGTSIYAVVDAEDPNGLITHVDFYLNNRFVRRESNPRYIWGKSEEEMKNLEAGTYTLRAVAYDSQGDSTEIVQKLFIQEPKYPAGEAPEVFIVSPAPNSRLSWGSDLAVKIAASDPEASIQYVRLFLDDELIGEKTRYPYQWEGNGPLQELPEGSHTLRAETMDYGGLGRETEIEITVASESESVVDSTDLIFLEVACAEIGSGFDQIEDPSVWDTSYVTTEFCYSSRDQAPGGEEQWLRFSFVPQESGTYALFGRTQALNHSRDSYWIRWNEGAWVRWDQLYHSSSFVWNRVQDADNGFAPLEFVLESGETHKLDIANREGGTQLDILCFSRNGFIPQGPGGPALNCEPPQTNTARPDGILRSMNLYLAPTLNPHGETPRLFLKAREATTVQLRLMDLQGRLKWQDDWEVYAGEQNRELQVQNLASGIYRLAIYSREGGVLSLPLLVKY